MERTLLGMFASAVMGICSALIVSLCLLASLGIVPVMTWSVLGLCLCAVLALALVK